MVVGLQVLLHPGVAAALAVVQDLVAQAPQGEQLVGPVGQLPDGVVELDLDALLVGLVDVGGLLLQVEEGVVDVGIDLVGVVDVHHRAAPRPHRVHRHVLMHEAGVELRLRVEGLEGGDEEADVEVQRVACQEASGAGVVVWR